MLLSGLALEKGAPDPLSVLFMLVFSLGAVLSVAIAVWSDIKDIQARLNQGGEKKG